MYTSTKGYMTACSEKNKGTISTARSCIRDMVCGRGSSFDHSSPAILKAVKNNELFYHFTASGIKDELERYNKDVLRISQSFESSGLKFFMMKTIRSYNYADDDIDFICVEKERFNEYVKIFNQLGYEFLWNRSMLREPGKYFFVGRESGGEKRALIHAHRGITWNGIEFLDSNIAWGRLRSVEISGKSIKVPSIEDEMLIMAAHSLHENTYVTAGELLHMKGLLSSRADRGLDLGYMFDMSKKFNWDSALKKYLNFIECSYSELTSSELFTESIKRAINYDPACRYIQKSAVPPYFIPCRMLIAGYMQKIFRDISALKILTVPREIFTFSLVVWLFRMKKRNKFFKNTVL